MAEPYSITEATVQLKDVIAWGVMLAGIVGTFTWAKITLQKQQKVIFNEQGEIRLVSFAALARIQASCKENRALEHEHLKEEIERMSTQSTISMSTLVMKIEELTRDIKQLTKCVTIMAAGGKSEDCR